MSAMLSRRSRGFGLNGNGFRGFRLPAARAALHPRLFTSDRYAVKSHLPLRCFLGSLSSRGFVGGVLWTGPHGVDRVDIGGAWCCWLFWGWGRRGAIARTGDGSGRTTMTNAIATIRRRWWFLLLPILAVSQAGCLLAACGAAAGAGAYAYYRGNFSETHTVEFG